MITKPTADEIRNDYLEGYNITTSLMSDSRIEQFRDYDVIPMIESIIRKSMSAETTHTEYYDGNGTSILILNRRNISSLVSIELIGVQDIIGTISVAAIDIIADEGILKARTSLSEGAYFSSFPKGKKNIKFYFCQNLIM